MFEADEAKRKKFEQGLKDGLSPHDAAIAAGYSR